MKLEDLGADAVEQLRMVSEVAGYLWDRGWAERNGGNISVNLTDIIDDADGFDSLIDRSIHGMPSAAEGMILFVTGTGERLRELRDPMRAGAVIGFGPSARSYRMLWSAGRPDGFRVTSELISHLLIHLDLLERSSPHRAVVHTHPTRLIALTHHPAYGHDGEVLTRTLWGMLPEVRAFVPGGIAIAPYTLPGSRRLAELTVEGLRTSDLVLWSKHGAVATGADPMEAFDYIDVADKGAAVLLTCLGAGFQPEGLSDAELDELEDATGPGGA